jgi:type IV pilus assembly protein PilW
MKTSNRGFTLIELLVAIAISLVAMVAASEAYIGARQTYRLQAMQTRLSDDGRFVLAMLQRTISQAGFRMSPLLPVASDRIAVSANVVTVKFTADGVNHISCDGSVPGGNTSQSLVIQRNGTSIQCVTNGAATPAAWLSPSGSGAGNGTEVVDFLVLLGIDTGPVTPSSFGCGTDTGTRPRDCITDKYAASLTGTEVAEQISSVRICVILRSEARDSSVIKQSNIKNCSSSDIVNTQSDGKLYREFWTTIQLRNR